MKYCNHYLPVPASDFSGAASILFNMDIMCLLYSPGACGSSVSDFDEIRLWKIDGYFYGTKMNEIDAVMGMEEEVVNQFFDIIKSKGNSVSAIAVLGTPVPAISGVSIKYIGQKIEQKTGKASIALPCNGFSIYSDGIYKTLINLGQQFLISSEPVKDSINIIGYSPLSHGQPFQLDELRIILEKVGVEILYDSSQNSALSEFKYCTRASCNLVISDNGVGLAEYMKKTFMVPYIMESPAGLSGISNILKQLKSILNITIPKDIEEQYESIPYCNTLVKKALVIGEPLYVSAMKKCLTEEFGIQIVIGFSFKSGNRKLDIIGESFNIKWIENEQMIHRILEEDIIDVVVADPLFEKFSNYKTTFVPIPWIGLSGNLFSDTTYRWVGKSGSNYLENFLR